MQKYILRTLIFLLPTQLGFHFWPNWVYIYGIRVDYFAPTVYLTDIVVLAFVASYVFQPRLVRKFLKARKRFLSLLGLFMIINIIFALNPAVSMVKWLKIVELGLFAYTISNIKFHKYYDIVLPLTLSLICISLIGITQFLNERSLGGIYYYLGERTFTVSTPGIALGEMMGKLFLRPYSTFSHPNSFAGYLLVSITLLWIFKKGRVSMLLQLALITSIFALLLAFSLSAYLGLSFALAFVVFNHYSFKFAQVSLITTLIVPWTTNTEIYDRIKLAEASVEMFKKAPFIGVGLGNFISALPTTGIDSSVIWKLQPVHNIFLLIVSELGIVGFAGFAYLIYKAMKSRLFVLPILLILLTGMFDHYWLTLQQNQLLLALILGMTFNKRITRVGANALV